MELAALGLKVEGIDNLDKAANSMQKLGAASEQAADGAEALAQTTGKLVRVESELVNTTDKAASSSKRLAEFMDASLAAQKSMDASLQKVVTSLHDFQGKAKSVEKVDLAGENTASIKSMDAALQKLTSTLDSFQAKSERVSKQEFVGPKMPTYSDFIGPTIPKGFAIPEANNELTEFEKRARAAGLSAGELKNALRSVPAQFTDIAVSLQGGMSPLTVFMQQGGQLKDMFGGAGPAARALGGYIMGLVTPMNLAAAGVAALGLAYYQGSKEADTFRLSLITTGNAAGLTVGQLQGMASAISETTGTTGAAASALATMVSAGVRAESELAKYTETAIRWAKYTGEGVEVVAERFVALQKEPVSAALKLNETTNFLTESVYKQIKALNDQGDSAGASALAMDAYSAAMDKGAKQIEANLGSLERTWLRITGAAKGAWDAMLNVGRSASMSDQLAEVEAELQRLEAAQGFANTSGGAATGRVTSGQNKALQAEIAALKEKRWALMDTIDAEMLNATASAEQAKRVSALAAVDKKYAEALKEKLTLDQTLANARKEATEAGKSEADILKILAFETEKYNKANKKPKGGGSSGVSELANIQARVIATNQYIKALQEQGAAADKITEGERLAYKIQLEIDSGRLNSAQKAQKIKELAAAKELQAAQEIAEFEKGRLQGEQQNINVLTQLAERMQLANLQGVELAKTQAVLGLNEYATPEQIKAVEDMAAALYGLDEAASKKKKYGDNPDKYIMGDTAALSGGLFDDQLMRYEMEREKEILRYQEAQERLVFARENQIRTNLTYDELEEQQARDHANRMAQIEKAKTVMMIKSTSDLFGQMMGILQTAGKEQSGVYKAMFLAQKAFAIAEILINTEMGAMKAVGTLGPFGMPMATVIRGMGYASAALVGATAIQGMAHDGIDSIPATGTWLLEKGERVTTANTSARLDSTLERIDSRMSQNGGNIGAAPKVTVQLIGGEFQNAQVEEDYDSINEETIIRVVSNDIARRGPITQAGTQYLGWSRVGT